MKVSSRVVAAFVLSHLAAAVSSPPAHAVLLEDFEAYRTGTVTAAGDNVTGGVWSTLGGNNAALQTAGGGLVMSIGAAGNSHALRSIPSPIADNTTATVYMRMRANATNVNASFGLSDVVAPTDANDFSAFEAQMRLINEASILHIDARNGGAFTDVLTPINLNQWYNVWMVVDSTANMYDIYVNSGAANATAGDLLGNDFQFRNGTTNANPLTTFLAYGGAGGVLGGSIDDIHVNAGTVLTNFASSPLMPGDVTGNGVTDINDFFPIRNNLFNSGMMRSQGDLSRNGIVDFDDFREWKDAASAAGMDVGGLSFAEVSDLYPAPEPSCAVLMLLAGAAMLRINSRRRRAA